MSARGRLAPLADLGLLVALAAAPVLGVMAGLRTRDLLGGNDALAIAVGAVSGAAVLGGAIVARYGRSAVRVGNLLVVVVTTVVVLAGTPAMLFAGFCDTTPNQPWIAWTGMGVVYFGLGMLSLRKRFLWGLPVAAVFAIVTYVALWYWLPGIPVSGSCGPQ